MKLSPPRILLVLTSLVLLCQCDDKGAAIRIKALHDEIDELNHQNAKNEADRRRLESQIESVKTEKKQLEDERAKVNAEKEAAEKRLNDLKAEFERYKVQYKLSMQKRAPGMQIEDFTSVDGKSYQQVVLKEISDTGIYFQHSGGLFRLQTKQLPETLQAKLGLAIPKPAPGPTISNSLPPRKKNDLIRAQHSIQVRAAEEQLNELRKKRGELLGKAEDLRKAIHNATSEQQPVAALNKQLKEVETAAAQLASQVLQAEVDLQLLRNKQLPLVPEK